MVSAMFRISDAFRMLLKPALTLLFTGHHLENSTLCEEMFYKTRFEVIVFGGIEIGDGRTEVRTL
jgi:hypothetical protein